MDRQSPGFAAGDYADIVAVQDWLIALSNNFGGSPTLDVFDPNLGQIASISLDFTAGPRPGKVHRVVVANGVSIDDNANGRIDANKRFTLARSWPAAAAFLSST